MTYVILALLVFINLIQLGYIFWQARDWREERAFLLQAALSKSLPELRSVTQPPQPVQFYDSRAEDDDFPVGM